MMQHACSSSSSREGHVRTALITGAVDTVITLAAFMASRSSVILADFLKTSLELIAVLLAWYTVRRMQRGGHHHYHYGIGKLEHLSSLLVGGLMIAGLLIILFSAVRNMLHPSHIGGVGVWISLSAQAVYLVINGLLYAKTMRTAKAEHSPLMLSQARLLMTRALANAFILLALVASLAFHAHAWALFIDPLASMVIAAFILLSAAGILSSSVRDLLDRALEEESQIIILRELVKFVDDFEQLHGVRTRRSGSEVFIDLFLEFGSTKTLREVQDVIDRLAVCLKQAIPGSHVAVALANKKVN